MYSKTVYKSRVVNIGNIPLGGDCPVRVQSMTNTNTLDTTSSVEQCIRIINEGADYVRLTTQGRKEAENLAEIKKELRKRGYTTPLVADVHFNPKVAEIAAAIVEKVRINPGNYTDSKHFQKIEYTETEYQAELNRIRVRLKPLLKICKEYQTAIRIGTNHGSLSDRIMSRYGDTPEGMVESAMEFLRICRDEDFHDIVLSMKASNTMIMVYSNRLLVESMMKEGMDYPLHLGVTEAGEAEDGRLKSAVGIGTLLAEGIGDTIRVSLSEEPEAEIPVAKKLVESYACKGDADVKLDSGMRVQFKKRESISIGKIGGGNVPVVIAGSIGQLNEGGIENNNFKDFMPEFIYVGSRMPEGMMEQHRIIIDFPVWKNLPSNTKNVFPLYTSDEYLSHSGKLVNAPRFVEISSEHIQGSLLKSIKDDKFAAIIIDTRFKFEGYKIINMLDKSGVKNPVIFRRKNVELVLEDFLLKSAVEAGSLFLEGYGDGIWLDPGKKITLHQSLMTSFGVLQASRSRMSKTEFISCPSCGRTLFNLQDTIAKIKARTSHLKHLKIGIMGCIVNGPGEMADADYGYVGSGPGKVTLYKGKQVMKKGIEEDKAVEELVSLIKEFGDWVPER